MDPEVVSDHPGACPRCGMALEPRVVSAEEGPDPELADMNRHFWIGLVLGLPVFVLAMVPMLLGHSLLAGSVVPWTEAVFTTVVLFHCGAPFFARAWVSVVHLSPTMFTLLALF